jgi:hypothetical protein
MVAYEMTFHHVLSIVQHFLGQAQLIAWILSASAVSFVGMPLGARVGISVGNVDGCNELYSSTLVGTSVGTEVGASVGASVGIDSKKSLFMSCEA